MLPSQTLHDFVLNLLTNPDARAAFDLDPESALRDAGLTDITAADVQDVVPLVVDSVPVHEVTTLAALGQPLAVDGLVDNADPVSQLQLLTSQLGAAAPSGSMSFTASVAGSLAIDPSGIVGGAAILPGIDTGISPAGLENGLQNGLSAVHDTAYTLDAEVAATGYAAGDAFGTGSVTDPAVATTAGAAGGLSGTVDAVLAPHGGLADPNFAVNVLSTTAHTATGLPGSAGLGDPLGGHDGLAGINHIGDPSSTLGAVTDHAHNTIGGLTGHDPVGGLTGTVHGATSGLSGSSLSGSAHGSGTGTIGDSGGHADAHTDASASGGHGLLGLTDGGL